MVNVNYKSGLQSKVKDLGVRCAFTMIELIFAIVIIAISMLALPMIMLQDNTSQETSLLQEGIMLTTTKVSQVLTHPWDPNSSPAGALMSMSQVLDTANGHADLDARRADPDADFRVGHFPEKLRRRLSPSNAIRAASAPGGALNSISGFNGTTDNVGVAFGAFSYKKQWEVNTTVSYVADSPVAPGYVGDAAGEVRYDFSDASLPGGQTSNIKMVQVTATDMTNGVAGDQVVLTSFSSNIGEAEFFKRRY